MMFSATHYVRSTLADGAVMATSPARQSLGRALRDVPRAAVRNAACARQAKRRVPLLRLLATTAALFWLGSNSTAGQAIRLTPPRPQLFTFATLTISTSPTAVGFNLVHGGTATASTAVTITTTYTGGLSLFGSLTLYAYFSSATNALTGGTPSASIPSSDVLGRVPTGIPTSYTSFSQITPYGGASGLELFLLTSILNFAGNRVDTLDLEINLAPTPQLPAATYTGTLTLEALAM